MEQNEWKTRNEQREKKKKKLGKNKSPRQFHLFQMKSSHSLLYINGYIYVYICI